MPIAYWMALLLLLIERFEEAHGQQLCWKGLRLLALDGTCINLPRWRWLRDYYGAAKNGKGKKKTQARMVLLQFPLTRLPYAYEVAPLSTGEVTLAGRLADHLRRNDLVLLDRGFYSYGLWWRIQSRGAYFAIRLKKQIRLQTLRRLGDKDCLVRWKPKDTRGKWKKEGWPPSIDFTSDSLSGPRLLRHGVADQHAQCPKSTPRGLGAPDDRLRSRPAVAAGAVPPPLGNRNNLFRVEGNPGDGREPAEPHAGRHRIRNRRPCAVVSLGALVDGGSGSRTRSRSPALKFCRGLARTSKHANSLADGEPRMGCESSAATPIATNRRSCRALSSRSQFSAPQRWQNQRSRAWTKTTPGKTQTSSRLVPLGQAQRGREPPARDSNPATPALHKRLRNLQTGNKLAQSNALGIRTQNLPVGSALVPPLQGFPHWYRFFPRALPWANLFGP